MQMKISIGFIIHVLQVKAIVHLRLYITWHRPSTTTHFADQKQKGSDIQNDIDGCFLIPLTTKRVSNLAPYSVYVQINKAQEKLHHIFSYLLECFDVANED